MALRFKFRQKFQGQEFISGRIYNFSYTAYEHDPSPLIIFLYWVEGTHPTTRRQWRFIQAINLNYISRSNRKAFVENWINTLYTTRDVKLTWNTVKRRYPEMTFATRRYFYSPNYYIKALKTITLEQTEKEIVGSLVKDFSTKTRIAVWTGLRKLQKTYSSIMHNRGRRTR